jgi:ATP synthase protein I
MSSGADPEERPDARQSLDRDVDRYTRREPPGRAFWRSVSVLGTIGWSIAIPAVAGAWAGHRLDLHFETGVRFTLMLLTVGVTIGCMVSWRVVRSHRE